MLWIELRGCSTRSSKSDVSFGEGHNIMWVVEGESEMRERGQYFGKEFPHTSHHTLAFINHVMESKIDYEFLW